MNRWMLWMSLAVLVVLIWLGPAGCLREDATEAETVEQEATNAEALGAARPDIERPEAEAILASFEALDLTRYEQRPTFWLDYLPEWPAGLRLKEFSASDAEPAAPDVQTRRLSLTLAVSTPTDADPATAPRAPGGWQATLAWVESLNAQPDMRLGDLKIDTTGGVTATFDVWLLDPVEEPEPEPEPEPDPQESTDGTESAEPQQ